MDKPDMVKELITLYDKALMMNDLYLCLAILQEIISIKRMR